MVHIIEPIKLVEIGTLGNICSRDMIRVSVYQGEDSEKFYGLVVNHCCSGDDQKNRVIMFNDLDKLEELAKAFSNKCEPSRCL